MKIINKANYKVGPGSYETNIGPSKTIQDESFTIKELLEKFAKGLNMEQIREVSYLDEKTADLLQNAVKPGADLTELDNLRRETLKRRSAALQNTAKDKEPANDERSEKDKEPASNAVSESKE